MNDRDDQAAAQSHGSYSDEGDCKVLTHNLMVASRNSNASETAQYLSNGLFFHALNSRLNKGLSNWTWECCRQGMC